MMGFIGTPLQVLCDQAPSHNGIRGATALTEIDTTKSRFLFESRTRRPTPQTQRPQTLLGPRPLSRSSENRSLWAKGDLNPHVPKDTGT